MRCDAAGLETTCLSESCPACGRLERWEDLAGGWHCERCEPRTRAIQLRQRADELRDRYCVMRDVAVRLNADDRIDAYIVESENFESIHNHSAYALIERDKEAEDA